MKLGCTATMLKQKCSRRSGWENCRPDQARQSRSNVKVMCIGVFLNWNGIVHFEFVPRGETVNKHFYLNVLKRFEGGSAKEEA